MRNRFRREKKIPKRRYSGDDPEKKNKVTAACVPEVLVIDSDGTKLGIPPVGEALRRAQSQGLNLVEVAPNVKPPSARYLITVSTSTT